MKSVAATRRRKLLQAGTPSPSFRLPKLDGGDAALEDLAAGGPFLLAFYKVTCPVCQFTFPFVERLYGGGKMRVYGVCQNDPADAREFNEEFGVTFPTLLDNEETALAASHAFGISSVPTLFWMESGGRIARVMEGWSKRDMEWLGEQAGVSPFRQGDRVPEWKAG